MSTRVGVFLGSLVVGVFFVSVLGLLVTAPKDPATETTATESVADPTFHAKNLLTHANNLLLGRPAPKNFLPYPFTIQILMWIISFICAGELLVRLFESRGESRQLQENSLERRENLMSMWPRDNKGELTALQPRSELTTEVREYLSKDKHFWLQGLLWQSIHAFQYSKAPDRAHTVFNTLLELKLQEIDLRYNMIRYLVWLIPTLGFIGTVVGIALTLSAATDISSGQALMKEMTRGLGVAFYTTLLALLQSALLVFIMHLVQSREENTLNRVGQYCLHMLNYLQIPEEDDAKQPQKTGGASHAT